MATACLGDDALAQRPAVFHHHQTGLADAGLSAARLGRGGTKMYKICCTVENQRQAQLRLPVYQQLPIRHKSIICSPLLSAIDLSPYLGSWVEEVTVGGESGEQARLCDYRWVLDIRRQCVQAQVPFYFMQTGARLLKDGKLYHIPRKHQHSQARGGSHRLCPPSSCPGRRSENEGFIMQADCGAVLWRLTV